MLNEQNIQIVKSTTNCSQLQPHILMRLLIWKEKNK